jgi:antigen 43
MGYPTCFKDGVRIRTARGDVPVESIVADEEVMVVRDGQHTLESVTWVGHSYIDLARHDRPENAAPIRFRKDAIADDQPERDLIVSPEHCFFIDGVLVPAKLLVNGGSIISERDHRPFTYHHIELETHGILLAENTPTESYLDTGNRSSFDNADVPRKLHPDFTVDATSSRWLTDACAPLAQVPGDVAPIWERLAERSQTIGYPIPDVTTVEDPDLHLLADGKVIRPMSDRDSRHVFAVPANVKSVSLVSRFCIPADKMIAGQRDTRRLGVSVNWIAIRNGDRETVIPSDHPGLTDGWNEAEQSSDGSWRWTDGNAALPWDNNTEASIVTVRCSMVDSYPVYDEKTRLVA